MAKKSKKQINQSPSSLRFALIVAGLAILGYLGVSLTTQTSIFSDLAEPASIKYMIVEDAQTGSPQEKTAVEKLNKAITAAERLKGKVSNEKQKELEASVNKAAEKVNEVRKQVDPQMYSTTRGGEAPAEEASEEAATITIDSDYITKNSVSNKPCNPDSCFDRAGNEIQENDPNYLYYVTYGSGARPDLYGYVYDLKSTDNANGCKKSVAGMYCWAGKLYTVGLPATGAAASTWNSALQAEILKKGQDITDNDEYQELLNQYNIDARHQADFIANWQKTRDQATNKAAQAETATEQEQKAATQAALDHCNDIAMRATATVTCEALDDGSVKRTYDFNNKPEQSSYQGQKESTATLTGTGTDSSEEDSIVTKLEKASNTGSSLKIDFTKIDTPFTKPPAPDKAEPTEENGTFDNTGADQIIEQSDPLDMQPPKPPLVLKSGQNCFWNPNSCDTGLECNGWFGNRVCQTPSEPKPETESTVKLSTPGEVVLSPSECESGRVNYFGTAGTMVCAETQSESEADTASEPKPPLVLKSGQNCFWNPNSCDTGLECNGWFGNRVCQTPSVAEPIKQPTIFTNSNWGRVRCGENNEVEQFNPTKGNYYVVDTCPEGSHCTGIGDSVACK